jgi:hypothetical protein
VIDGIIDSFRADDSHTNRVYKYFEEKHEEVLKFENIGGPQFSGTHRYYHNYYKASNFFEVQTIIATYIVEVDCENRMTINKKKL